MRAKRAALLLIALAAFVTAFAPFPALDRSQPTTRNFRVYASQFSYQPAVLDVNPGDTVTIELVSTDVVHGLYVDGYGVSTSADPGQPSRLTFVADRSGSFNIRCNVTCGAMHPFMLGKLNVGANLWLYRSFGLASIALAALFVFRDPRQIIPEPA